MMVTLQFTKDEIAVLDYERFHHVASIVRKRMTVLWALAQNKSRTDAALIGGVCLKTVKNCIQIYRKSGMDGLRQLHYKAKTSKLSAHKTSIEDTFKASPPRSVKEASKRIEELTQVELSNSQVARFLRKIGMKPLRTGSIPAKADVAKQKTFLEDILEPLIQKANNAECYLFFMDASHYVLSPYAGILWCFVRVFIRATAGRNRINVLGAINAVSLKLETVINTDYINANTIEQMLRLLHEKYADKPIAIILDNARYQHCDLVKNIAQQLGIQLVFLPAYSPNLNLIERLWKFIKNKAIYNQYFENATVFHQAVTKACCKINNDEHWKTELKSLLTLKFQTFEKCNILAETNAKG